MTASTTQPTPAVALFELRGDSFTLPVLQLLGADMEGLSRALGAKIAEAPEFFRNAPVVVDLKQLDDHTPAVDFPLLIGILRGHGLIPVGVRGGDEGQNRVASTMELAILSDGRGSTRSPPKPTAETPPQSKPVPRAVKAPAPSPPTGASQRMVRRPVRSGQRVLARGGDLVVMAQVGSGAEVLADGNIHIYGTLRGRALAGIGGDEDARIFCQGLEAELISIAGNYRVSEDVDPKLRSRPVQIFLEGGRLHIEPL